MSRSLSTECAEEVQALFDEIVERDPEVRAAYLDQACPDAIRREVESLLAAHDNRAGDLRHALEHLLLAPQPTADGPGKSVEPDTDPLVGQTLSRYQIQERLGGGGMGVVYKARDTKLDRTVALKFLPPHLSLDDEPKVRFIHEAKAASALDHANICTIHDIDETEAGQLFIAMAFYAGETLKKKIARGPLPVEEALDYAVQVAEGLSRAHEAGIVHRDIKPANVMVTADGVVKIVDFGLAKVQDVSLTQTGTTLGTVAYMSPEQARGEAVDHRTDLWSLGVVLYEMLTGERPFRGDHAQAIIYAIRHDAPKPVRALRPEVPETLEEVVQKLLRKDPEERYGQAEEMLADLKSLHQPVERARPESEPVSAPSSRRPRVLLYGGVALLLILLLLVGQALFTGRQAAIDSIAVLPMKNLSGDPDQEIFADAMTDLLINNLGTLSGLERVISRTSMMRYKGSDKSMQEIGRELEVDALVEASVLSDSEQVIITVNLIESGTERHLWGDRYERPWRDVLKVQSEMALAIAQEVSVALTPLEQAHLEEASEVNPEAYRLYLLGLHYRFQETGVPSWTRAIESMEQAITIDPDFAQAHAWLASSYLIQGYLGWSHEEALSKGRQALERALALNPNLSEAYVSKGLIHELYEWDWQAAEQAFIRAITLNPGNREAYREYGNFLDRMGRPEEALAQFEHVTALDPLWEPGQYLEASAYLHMGQYDQAITEALKGLELYPNNRGVLGILWEAYLERGMTEEAANMCNQMEKSGSLSWKICTVQTSAVSGKRTEAQEVLDELIARWEREQRVGIARIIAAIYARLGEHSKAMDWLERLYEARSLFLLDIKRMNAFYSLRAEPRFQALLEKMGME